MPAKRIDFKHLLSNRSRPENLWDIMAAIMPGMAINRRVTAPAAIVCFFLLAWFTAVVVSVKESSHPRAEYGQVTGHMGAQFAIADFDGDQRPDLATIYVVSDSERASRYSIQFQLSAGPWTAIRIAAPSGGLLVLPRDVNGDNFADLIVTTAIGSQFVAVLLNDGHGHFTEAEPGAVSVYGIGVDASVAPPEEGLVNESSVIPSRFTSGLEGGLASGCQPQTGANSIPLRKQGPFFRFPPQIRTGRAPPESVFLS